MEQARDLKLSIIADDDSSGICSARQQADALVCCGDLADGFILQAAQRCACAATLAVKGNHDGAGAFPAPIVDLHLRTFAFGGLLFGGFGGAWRYKLRGHHLYEQEEVTQALREFPSVDVFVAHNSPHGVHDREDEVHLGFEAFGDYIRRAQPRLFLHGHQHVNEDTPVGNTRVIGTYGQRRLVLPIAL